MEETRPTPFTTKPRPDGESLPLAVRNDKSASAYELRLTGKSWESVAEISGWGHLPNSGAYAQKQVKNFLENAAVQISREEQEHLLQVECDRLDRMQAIVWEQVEAGELKAVDTVLRIMSQRAKLLGLETINVNQNVTSTTVLVGGTKENFLRTASQVVKGEIVREEAS